MNLRSWYFFFFFYKKNEVKEYNLIKECFIKKNSGESIFEFLNEVFF